MKRRKWLCIIFSLATFIVSVIPEESRDDWIYKNYIQLLSYGPSLIVRPDSSIVPADTRISFFCRADGNPLPNVVWRKNEQVITDNRYTTKTLANGLSTLRIEPVLLDDSNSTISCTADNGVGTPIKAEATLTVLSHNQLPEGFPIIEAHPALKSVEQGRTAHVTCRVEGDPRPKVLWLRDLMPIDIRSNPRYSVSTLGNPEVRLKVIGALMIQQAREEDQGRYECIARNSLGVVHSKGAHLYVKVRRVPPYFTYKLERVYKIGIGGSVNLTCVAVGYPMPRVFWKRQSDDFFLNDPQTAPIGKNVLTLTNLEQTENYTCIAVSKLGNIETSTVVEVKELLPPPTNLKIIEITATTVSLRWTPVTSVPDDDSLRGYVVKYRQKLTQSAHPETSTLTSYAERGAYKEVKIPGETNSALVENLEPYQLYEFSAQAVSTIGRGTLSSPVEAQTSEAAPGAPPANVQARSLNRNSILIRWDPPIDKQNGRITGYQIHYTSRPLSTDISEWDVKEAKHDELMTTLYELDPEKTYYVQVQAKNAKGFGPLSRVVTVITRPGVPAQPTNLVAKPLDSHRIQLNWQTPMHSYNINGYIIQYGASDESVKELTLSSDIQKHAVDGLRPNTVYTFRVAAQSDRGQGAFGDDAQAKTHESVPTLAPQITDVRVVSSTVLHVFWNPIEDSSQKNESNFDDLQENDEIINYKIEWRPFFNETLRENDDSNVKSEENSDGNEQEWDYMIQNVNETTDVKLKDLKPYQVYEIRIAAENKIGFGPYGQIVQQMTRGDVPSSPKDLEVILVNASAVKLSWEKPENSNGELLGYYVYKEKLLNGEPVYDKLRKEIVIADPNKLHTLITNLEPNTEYAFRVNAFNMYGDGEHSSSRKIMTGGIPPSEPRPQSVSLLNEDPPLRARIEWLPPEITYDQPINKYVIWYRPVDKQEFERAEVPGTQHFVELNNLSMGREYEIRLAAANDEGLSINATERLITPIGVPNGEPLNVRYDIVGGQLNVQWDPPEMENRNGNITYYRAILTPLDGEGKKIDRNISEKSVTFRVNAKNRYSFKVSAATMKGEGPFSEPLNVNPYLEALVGPPSNVRVQATSNSSAVIQWDFDETQTAGSADGFVVKYIHEPVLNGRGGGDNTDNWRAQTVNDPTARHLEITRLTVHKPYAFCVLAIKQSRLGPCSDPPVIINDLKPTHMVHNLHVQYKTSQSVALQWDYDGPQPIGFYIKQSGKKNYLNQFLEEKSLVAPGFEKRVEGVEKTFMWQNLRPYMDYTFQVGVFSPKDGTIYWPRELMVRTDPTGPPFVDTPEFVESKHPGTAVFKLKCASEEYGPISHYWIIVVPGNYTKDDVLNMDSQVLEKSTIDLRPRLATMNPSITAKVRKSTKIKEPAKIISPKPDADDDEEHSSEIESQIRVPKHKSTQKARRYLRDTRKLDGVYIAANIPSHQMQLMTREERLFTLGDGKEYDGFLNHPLDPNSKYSLMMRAFAKSETLRRSDRPFEFRPPMQEPTAKLFTDSMLGDPFGSKGSGMQRTARGSNFWLIGPAIALLVICVIIGMLVIWWLRCSRKGVRTTHRNGSIAKVALSNAYTNGGPNETSKLLLGTDQYGRPVMNAYEMNGNMESSMTYPEPTYATHTNGHITSNGHANGHVSTGGNYPTVQLPLMSNSTTGGIVFSRGPVPLPEFASHIDKLRMNNNALFTQEFESIETGQRFTWEASSLDYNKPKNRYANVVAYDHSRVILSTQDGTPGSDYINANYIDGYDRPKAYIATQGPLPETFADFWRMVWEERSATIVMLTKLEERSRIKCDLYWPTRGTSIYGKIAVSLLETLELAHYTIRTMRLENLEENEAREIRHLQYTAWPDHGVPDHPTPFLMFLKRVKALNPVDAGPIISHCSAGIGRTGAFIVIDIMLDRLRYENTVDIYGCVTALRYNRSYMVQTDDQYIFIHDAVLDAAQSGSTEVPASKLYHHLQVLMQIQHHDQVSGLEIEFRTLATLKTLNSRCQVGGLSVNKNKNRQHTILPYDSSRVILQSIPGIEGSDYINASWVDGYRQRNAYIATQGPLLQSTDDFWRMLWENGSCIVVMLTQLRERGADKCCTYYPVECGVQFGNLVVEPIAEYNMPQYILREFKMADPQTGQTRTMRHFQYTEWPEQGVPTNTEYFIDFIHQVHRTKVQFGVDGPICVHCSTGTGRTGVFVALSIIIDRMKLEHVVDVFTTVKLLRTERQNMVQEKEEYEFCYRAALEFLATYDNPYSQ